MDIAVVDGTVSSMTSASLNLYPVKIIPKKVKCTRDTSGATQTKRVAALKKKEGYKIAFKHASSVYAREKAKKGVMSASSVSKMIEKEFHVHVTPRTIQRQVKNGDIGTSPIRRGPKGNIPERHYPNLLVTFESFVTKSQFSGGTSECRHKPLAVRCSKDIKTKDWTQAQQKDFLQRVLNSLSAMDGRDRPLLN